jgi:hypothetical protein
MFVQQIHTHSALFDPLRRNPKNTEDLYHNLNNYVLHFHGRRDFRVDLETPEKHLNALEYVDKSVLVRPSILGRLRDKSVTMAHTKLLRNVHTERRRPIPANMTFAGENTCHMNMSVHISDKFM